MKAARHVVYIFLLVIACFYFLPKAQAQSTPSCDCWLSNIDSEGCEAATAKTGNSVRDWLLEGEREECEAAAAEAAERGVSIDKALEDIKARHLAEQIQLERRAAEAEQREIVILATVAIAIVSLIIILFTARRRIIALFRPLAWYFGLSVEFKLLKQIMKKREITIGELRTMVSSKFNDHRDYYEAAGLITGGYLECTMHKQGDRKQFPGATSFDREEIWFSQMKEHDVAIQIYTMTLGQGEHEYREVRITNPRGILDARIFPTSKAFLYLNSERQTRRDRIATLAIGISVGLVLAVVGETLTRKL